MDSVGERVTDLIFRMEQLDEGFVGSTWSDSKARHESPAPSTSEIGEQQQAAIDGTRSARRSSSRSAIARSGSAATIPAPAAAARNTRTATCAKRRRERSDCDRPFSPCPPRQRNRGCTAFNANCRAQLDQLPFQQRALFLSRATALSRPVPSAHATEGDDESRRMPDGLEKQLPGPERSVASRPNRQSAMTSGKGRPVPYLLNLVYLASIALASPWLLYQRLRKGKYREGFAEKLLGRFRASGQSALRLAPCRQRGRGQSARGRSSREIRRDRPRLGMRRLDDHDDGLRPGQKKLPDLTVFYCPLDFTWAVRAAMRRIRPDCWCWPNWNCGPISSGPPTRTGARVAIINGRLSDRSFRGYRRLRPFVSPVLRAIDLVAAQNEEYADRFRALGAAPDAVHVTGSIKFDGAQTDRAIRPRARLRDLAGIRRRRHRLPRRQHARAGRSAGARYLSHVEPRVSATAADRRAAASRAVRPRSRGLLADSGIAWQRRSTSGNPKASRPQARILLVDAVGELGAWWGTAHIAFVGGSLGNRGGQNMIEPAAYGAAVSFGPNTQNFRDIVAQLLAAEAAVVVHDGASSPPSSTLPGRRHFPQTLGRPPAEFVAGQLGATARTLDLLERLVEPADQPQSRSNRSAA